MTTREGTISEAAAIEHINGLIADARTANPPGRLTGAERSATARWLSVHPDEVARLVQAAMRWEQYMEFVPDREWGTIALYRSRQTTFRQLCGKLGLPDVAYQKDVNGRRVGGLV
ncbi:hypothetical protein PIB30_072969 [Stylosanthes scabra]|uniref:Uncharacterized protein n=1 Tax=Stylosanthes scabra TaxID=79078 RepID=A0ABU6SPY0_9FABA|nr:hypothetical protein [Stylosanthes scabra]